MVCVCVCVCVRLQRSRQADGEARACVPRARACVDAYIQRLARPLPHRPVRCITFLMRWHVLSQSCAAPFLEARWAIISGNHRRATPSSCNCRPSSTPSSCNCHTGAYKHDNACLISTHSPVSVAGPILRRRFIILYTYCTYIVSTHKVISSSIFNTLARGRHPSTTPSSCNYNILPLIP